MINFVSNVKFCDYAEKQYIKHYKNLENEKNLRNNFQSFARFFVKFV